MAKSKAITVEIKRRVDSIKANVQNMHNSRAEIIKDLIYLSEHKRELKAATGQTFEELVKEITGFSRRYLNQLVSNYKFLEKYNRLELYNVVDVKVIEGVRKQNKPELLDRPGDLKRSKIGRPSPVSEPSEVLKNWNPEPIDYTPVDANEFFTEPRTETTANINELLFNYAAKLSARAERLYRQGMSEPNKQKAAGMIGEARAFSQVVQDLEKLLK